MEPIGAHAQGLREAETAAATPDYLHWLKGMINLVDDAMAKEHVAAEVRDRVVARLRYGTPEPTPDDLAVIDMLADAAPEAGR